ncbi:hypothetical protein K0M31_019744 [Melipona bicolor]|uniref:Uncharacterized protein n=1 Tax=Melipona bicolor TaxID=60889 RepID=A0AA40G307_9HYME|nr:hypothetical protein K0M31_019744 [Melipona bicolor]
MSYLLLAEYWEFFSYVIAKTTGKVKALKSVKRIITKQPNCVPENVLDLQVDETLVSKEVGLRLSQGEIDRL